MTHIPDGDCTYAHCTILCHRSEIAASNCCPSRTAFPRSPFVCVPITMPTKITLRTEGHIRLLLSVISRFLEIPNCVSFVTEYLPLCLNKPLH